MILNPVVVWVTVIILCGGTIFIWYVTYPMVWVMLNFNQNTILNSGIAASIQAYGLQSFSFLEWANLLWPGLLVVLYIIWGNLAMHEVSVESEVYG